ncbi:MAG: hypothetical protein U1F76_05140 [Candidatus Competibacteraceae bacterium]
MTAKLQALIIQASELSVPEQLELIGHIAQSLRQHQTSIDTIDFWKPKTLDQLIQAQGTQPAIDLASLIAGFWPERESADEFIEFTRQQRYEDRLLQP